MTYNLNSQKGYSLVEILMVCAVSAIIAGAMFGAARMGQTQSHEAETKMTVQDSAREGLYKMLQEIRQTSPDRVNITNGGNTITFNVPDSNNAVSDGYGVNWSASHQIRYAVGADGQLIRTNLTTNSTTVMANEVSGILFETANNGNVVKVALSVTKEADNGRNIPGDSLTLNGEAELRNSDSSEAVASSDNDSASSDDHESSDNSDDGSSDDSGSSNNSDSGSSDDSGSSNNSDSGSSDDSGSSNNSDDGSSDDSGSSNNSDHGSSDDSGSSNNSDHGSSDDSGSSNNSDHGSSDDSGSSNNSDHGSSDDSGSSNNSDHGSSDDSGSSNNSDHGSSDDSGSSNNGHGRSSGGRRR